MTNENYAMVSAIRSFRLEPEIYKTVLKKLIDEDANNNVVVLLLNPELTEQIIQPGKYTEALDYVMNTYQQERSLIVKEMRLKAYEQKVQGPIEEAKVTSVPTREAIDLNSGISLESKSAKDAARTFEDPTLGKEEVAEKVGDTVTPVIEGEDLVPAVETAKDMTGLGATEIEKSVGEVEKKAQETREEFEKRELKKATVETPSVNVLPAGETVEKDKVEEETLKEKPEEEIKEPVDGLDEEEHEVKAQRETTSFFQRHKKGILIATGLAMVALTSVAFPTLIVPSLMHANSILALHAPFEGIKTVLHGLNTVLGKVIGATFNAGSGLWTTASEVAINGAAASTGLATAVATYGVWGVFGKGFVNSIKRMFKAVDMESPKKEEKEEQTEEVAKGEPEPDPEKDYTEPFGEKSKEAEVTETPKEEKSEDVKTAEAAEPTLEEEPKPVEKEDRFSDVSDDDFQRLLAELKRQKEARERMEKMAAEAAEEIVAEEVEKGKGK